MATLASSIAISATGMAWRLWMKPGRIMRSGQVGFVPQSHYRRLQEAVSVVMRCQYGLHGRAQLGRRVRQPAAGLDQQRRVRGLSALLALVAAGAAELPPPIKRLMKLTAKVMTRTAYWF